MESVVVAVLGVLLLAFGVAASIALHEIGHLVPAKRFGVKCTQYMIGFGPTVWSTRRGETEYGVKAIPLGGYVRMLGMFPPKPGEAPREGSTGRMAMLVDQARESAQREIEPQDRDRLFYQRSIPKRVVVMLGGPVMNLLIALVLFTLLFTTYGTAKDTPVVSAVSQCVLPVSTSQKTPDPTCPATGATPTPAVAAGLQAGDRIVSFAGRPIQEWSTLQELIRANPGRTLPLVVERSGRDVALSVTLIRDNRPKLDRYGTPVTDSNGKIVLVPVGFLGVSPTVTRAPLPITAVPAEFGSFVVRTVDAITNIPAKMVGVVKAATFQGERDPNGPVSIVGVGRITGEATKDAPDSGYGLRGWLVFYLGVIAALNMALFIFNLIPLLPLDGGHVAGALWEGARRTVARLRHRADPGPTDVARLLPIAYAASALLIAMSVLLIYADIVNPIKVTG